MWNPSLGTFDWNWKPFLKPLLKPLSLHLEPHTRTGTVSLIETSSVGENLPAQPGT